MAQANHRFSDAGSRGPLMARPSYTIEHAGLAVTGPALCYSSPKPWILAIAISSGLWIGIGWAIWAIIR